MCFSSQAQLCAYEHGEGEEVDLTTVVLLVDEDNEVRKGAITMMNNEGSDDKRLEYGTIQS